MLTVYSEIHRLHAPAAELSGGKLVPPFENPTRMERVLEQVRGSNLGEVIHPQEFERERILKVHSPDFTEFLESAWSEWKKTGSEGEAIPWVMPTRGTVSTPPKSIEGKMGLFAFAADTAITSGTWEAAQAAAKVALTGQSLVAEGEPSVFALCRPPGHHAAADLFGGYCFLNNAAIAAQAFLDFGAHHVAILDVDFHHGNGTQAIFYERADVLFQSLHGDPREAFPFYWGHADETGQGEGEGWNVNYPLPSGTTYDRWAKALDQACDRIHNTAPDALIVSLGVDTFRGDPISFFGLESEDFIRCGARLRRLGLPTLFVMEGGYAVEEIGINTVNVLSGFEDS